MEYRQLGRSGVMVSVIGLGTNRFGSPKLPQPEVMRAIDAAQDLGINFIDTANVYQGGRSEETLGAALKGRWDRFVLASKFSHETGSGPNDRGTSRYHLMNAVEASLRRLQSDHIDLYYIHRWDPSTPLEESLRALDDLVRSGKVRYLGASNFAAWQLARSNTMAELQGWSPFIAVQNHYHLLERGIEREVMPYAAASGIGVVPYFPLAGGFLTGKYKAGQPAPAGSRGETNSYVQQYMTPERYAVIEQLEHWAGQRGHTLGDLAHAWLLAHPQVSSVISGATQVDQIVSNARAGDWLISDEERKEIDAILENQPAS